MNRSATAAITHPTLTDDPIRSNREGSFSWNVLAHRHPALIEQVRQAHPYGPEQLARLDDLHQEIVSGTITELPVTARD